MTQPSRPVAFTGRHMLMIMIGFFGVIIAVNVTMARLAGSTFGGLVVENSYVASQEFNTRLQHSRDQIMLGWTTHLDIHGGTIRYRLTDHDGKTVVPSAVTVAFRHPSYQAKDWAVSLKPAADGSFEASDVARDGVWTVQADSDVGLEAPYREVRRIIISKGAIR
jgi:nitrogen fixation protein FixH